MTQILSVGVPQLPPAAEMSPVGFTPEAILATLEQRLDDIDGQIQRLHDAVESRTKQANAINEQIGDLRNVLASKQRGPNQRLKLDELEPEHLRALNEAGFDVPTPEDVAAHGNALPNKLDVRPNLIEDKISELNTDLSQLNSRNEMRMLMLQQLVSQRSKEVSLATNALKSMSKSASEIARNIGR
jgi:DNA repair exonuclease SbcCD ATPase subunit